jgi:imidazolonepropionase-like amidohydrolase
MHWNSRCLWPPGTTLAGYGSLGMMLSPSFSCEEFYRKVANSLIALAAIACYFLILPAAPPARAQQATAVLFQNVRIFDGKSDALSAPSSVLIRDNKIEKISTATMPVDGAELINGGGRVLMPGLIDAHWHAMLARSSPIEAITGDVGYLNLVAAAEATATLMRGFTTIRDVGGPVFGLKRAIDEGVVVGPRVYPSGAMITTTGGHADFRPLSDLPRSGGELSRGEEIGGSAITDNPDEVRLRTREQLAQGASQVKLVGGGGVASPLSPLDMVTFTEPELRAAVEIADNWGTYVTVHAYTPASIRLAIAAGAKCIEHGHLMDEATAKLMADKGIWLSTQPFVEEDSAPLTGQQRERLLQVVAGTDKVYALAKKYKLKTAFGTDLLFSEKLAARQNAALARLTRWYATPELLKMATATNGELLALSGPRNPYPGKLGVVEEGALADLLLVDGNPIENIALIEDPAKNFLVIMKDGKIYKNALAR